MILNTGSRTDIPAHFGAWFLNRVRAGTVCVRNPYYREQVTRYRLDPALIDCMVFCTKNPAPLLESIGELSCFSMLWYVTITPYGREIEPYVPPKEQVVESFWELSRRVGPNRVCWRYDPVFVSAGWSERAHEEAFDELAGALEGATGQCVVSFIDLYEKTRRNFPEAREVAADEQERLIAAFSRSARRHGMRIHLCCESPRLVRPGVDADGCLSQAVVEEAIGCGLRVPARKGPRPACACLLGADIGAYNSCPNGCRYCYANADQAAVRANLARHDPGSPFLIGGPEPGDVVHEAHQVSWRDRQPRLFS